MEVGAHVWLRSDQSQWGWLPAIITDKEPTLSKGNVPMVKLTLRDDPTMEDSEMKHSMLSEGLGRYEEFPRIMSGYGMYEQSPFEVFIMVDPEQLKTVDHEDIKLRNLPAQDEGSDNQIIIGGVDDLIGLTHLHEPAILHALRQRYDSDIIYTSTGPILIAVNPFKELDLYNERIMQNYRLQGEQVKHRKDIGITPGKFKAKPGMSKRNPSRLAPHPYQTADDAYRAMMRGVENNMLVKPKSRRSVSMGGMGNQSILVSGESGAGKTVTTKIVLEYFAMLSRQKEDELRGHPSIRENLDDSLESISVETQILDSNPILESFGNARTIRNDNSSRFGKYIDITFTPYGKVSGASIETYLLEKVRLIHPGNGERNYHVFYQFIASATHVERKRFFLENRTESDFKLLSESDTFDRRDGVSDEAMHAEMLDSMTKLDFEAETIWSLMRLVMAILFCGNMEFKEDSHAESCELLETHASVSAANLLGVSFSSMQTALTSRNILAGTERLTKPLTGEESIKAMEAMVKAIYGAMFDYLVEKINISIHNENGMGSNPHQNNRKVAILRATQASIGVLDIFGFEVFKRNNFEQICINYTNEALQQQFNKYVFKLEQREYESEGILWKFISFPDNQDVLDLIDARHTGILALLDEQCILPKSTDEKFTRYLYTRCDNHSRFKANAHQKVVFKFCIEHYAGPVEYETKDWLEKNKDQLHVASARLLSESNFELLLEIQKFIRTDERSGRGSIATKSVGSQFSTQLSSLRARIDQTVPHYIRCLKPNDDLVPNDFEPRNIVDQLRCGGVLEAVRVSRAGYPTRYLHETFLARYTVLMEEDKNSRMPKEEKLRCLVDRIAFLVWEEEYTLFKSRKEKEKKRLEAMSPRYKARMTPPRGAAATSKHGSTPCKIGTPTTCVNDQAIAFPESIKEFEELDFTSRCAVAGLQLGRTKVFIRREAFDRMEAIRSQTFYGAATAIQSVVRGKLYRERYLIMKYSATVIQSVLRMHLAKMYACDYQYDQAALRIQQSWRYTRAQSAIWQCVVKMKMHIVVIQRWYKACLMRSTIAELIRQRMAVVKIQACWRGSHTMLTYGFILRSIVRFQALARGRRIRMLKKDIVLNDVREKKLPVVANKFDNLSEMPVKSPPRVERAERVRIHTSLKSPSPIAPVTALTPRVVQINDTNTDDLYRHIDDGNWAMVENILDKFPDLAQHEEPSTGELPLHILVRHSGAWTLLIDMVLVLFPKALIHRDQMGALPIHHATASDNLAALEIIYGAYKEGINEFDGQGRFPIHIAAEFDSTDSLKFLLAKAPEGAYTMVNRPPVSSGGGLPLHIACRNYASIGVITALLAENFASAKRSDENGDLPLHLVLRCGEIVDQVVVKTLLTCFASAASRTDMYGDLPLTIALKHSCKPAVINTLLIQFPDAAGILNGEGQSPLHLAFENDADDRTILGLLNHAPELATSPEKSSNLLPIQVATKHEHSPFIVHNLLKRDMPIDLKEKVRAQLLPHHYSWNHVVSGTNDQYHMVISKLLQQCTQPQVLALAHVEDREGQIALATATAVCKHELRVMLRLFNTLEVVNQRPAYSNPISDTQIFYALRYEPPPQQNGAFTILHEDKRDDALADYIEDWDDSSQFSGISNGSRRSTMSGRSQWSIDEKVRYIRKEKGQQVIAKLTSRSDIVERELKVRKEFHLSRHYVPAILSVHHTVQHAAYSEAMAEPGYCITMEGADSTAENLMLDLRKTGKSFPAKALKRIGISLLHMHEHGIIHGDFGTHNIGKFGSRWKLLGVGGAITIGDPSDPKRGFYNPPESIRVESKRAALGKKTFTAKVIPITAQTTYDIWAYGVVVYEAISGTPLSPYACRGKRAMNASETAKIGRWDDVYLKKALKNLTSEESDAKDLLKQLLHPDPNRRNNSMKGVLEHPFFTKDGSSTKQREIVNVKTSTSPRKGSNDNGNKKISRSSTGSSAISGRSRSGGSHHSGDYQNSYSRTGARSPVGTKITVKSSNMDASVVSPMESRMSAKLSVVSNSDLTRNNQENSQNGVLRRERAIVDKEVDLSSLPSKKSKRFSGLSNKLRNLKSMDSVF